MSKKGHRQRRRLQAQAPPSGPKPSRHVAARARDALAAELVTDHTLCPELLARRAQGQWSAFSLRGQLSTLARKSVDPRVLALQGPEGAAVRAVQQFPGQGAWEEASLVARPHRVGAESGGEPAGGGIFEGSGFPPHGPQSGGVAPPECGAMGKLATCQQGVFAAYLSRKGSTCLERPLSMPHEGCDAGPAPRRQRYGVPREGGCQTDPQRAVEMVRGVVKGRGVPCKGVVADEHYGRIPALLDGVAAGGQWDCAAVPLSTTGGEGPPPLDLPGHGPRGRPRQHPRGVAGAPPAAAVRQVAAPLPARAWRRSPSKAGRKGPLEVDLAFVRATRARRGRPGPSLWGVFGRSLAEQPTGTGLLSHAPAACSHAEVVRGSGWRWPVETASAEAKGERGRDH